MPDEVNSNLSNPTLTETVQPEMAQLVSESDPAPETVSQAQDPDQSAPSTYAPPEMPSEAPEAPRNDSVSESSNIPENTALNKV